MRNKLRLEKRESVSTIRIVLTSILFTLIAFAFCGIIIASVGFNPLEVYGKMLNKVFLSGKGIRKMINASLPLMFCGLGVALTFKMNLNNIGAEGQYAMGAIFGGAFVLYGSEIRGIGGGIILAVMCFLGGAFWALLCAIPKAYWNVNESITTLMLNYIALIILSYLVLGPWKMPGQNVGQTKRIPVGLEIPEINGISAGIILGIVAAVVIFLAYKYTTDGYQLSVIRSSQNSARYAGINIKRNIILALVISGGLAGLAGYVQYAGVSHRIMEHAEQCRIYRNRHRLSEPPESAGDRDRVNFICGTAEQQCHSADHGCADADRDNDPGSGYDLCDCRRFLPAL